MALYFVHDKSICIKQIFIVKRIYIPAYVNVYIFCFVKTYLMVHAQYVK